MVQETRYGFSLRYQERIAAALLTDPTFLDEYRSALDSRFFEQHDHQQIIRLLLRYHDRYGKKPTREALLEEIRMESKSCEWPSEDKQRIEGGVEKLLDLRVTSEVDQIKERCSHFGQHQALKNAIYDSIEIMEENEKDPDASLEEVLPKIQTALTTGQQCDTGFNVFDFFTDINKVRGKTSDPHRRIATGWPKVDQFLGNGLGPGELGFILAESGKGKSMALTNIAAAAIKGGKKVVYWTLELAPFVVAVRILAKLTTCSMQQVKDLDPYYLRMIEQFVNGSKVVWKREPEENYMQVFYSKPSQSTIHTLRAKLTRLEVLAGWRPDLIIVDYIDEMRGRPVQSRRLEEGETYHTYGQISADLLDLGVDYACPIWSASQVTRVAYGEEPNLGNVGRSMQKVDKAHFVMALCQTKKEKEDGKIRMKILKIRDGAGKDKYISCREDFAKASIIEQASGANPGVAAEEEEENEVSARTVRK
jgi:replicative DNA helicase